MRKSPSSQLSLLAVAPTVPPKGADKKRTQSPPASGGGRRERRGLPAPLPLRDGTGVGSVTVKAAKSAEKARAGEKKTRAVPEPMQTAAAGGAVWKMSGKNGVAYVKDAALAGELLAVDAKKLATAAMAVYYDKRGKPFAWQVRFDAERWEEILRRLA